MQYAIAICYCVLFSLQSAAAISGLERVATWLSDTVIPGLREAAPLDETVAPPPQPTRLPAEKSSRRRDRRQDRLTRREQRRPASAMPVRKSPPPASARDGGAIARTARRAPATEGRSRHRGSRQQPRNPPAERQGSRGATDRVPSQATATAAAAKSQPMWAVPCGPSNPSVSSAPSAASERKPPPGPCRTTRRLRGEPTAPALDELPDGPELRTFVEQSMAAAAAALAERRQPEAARRVLARALAVATASAGAEEVLELLPPLQNALSCALRRLGRPAEGKRSSSLCAVSRALLFAWHWI